MSTTTAPTIRAITNLLALAGRFNRLAKSCPPEHRRDFYRLKDRALVLALQRGEGQFTVDSLTYGRTLMLGVTHASGRRVHVPAYRMPGQVQLTLHRLAAASGLRYPLIRLDAGGKLCGHPAESGRNAEPADIGIGVADEKEECHERIA